VRCSGESAAGAATGRMGMVFTPGSLPACVIQVK